MGTRRHPRGSPLYTRWALEWRGDDPRLSQFLRATNHDTLSEEPLHCLSAVAFRELRNTLEQHLIGARVAQQPAAQFTQPVDGCLGQDEGRRHLHECTPL